MRERADIRSTPNPYGLFEFDMDERIELPKAA